MPATGGVRSDGTRIGPGDATTNEVVTENRGVTARREVVSPDGGATPVSAPDASSLPNARNTRATGAASVDVRVDKGEVFETGNLAPTGDVVKLTPGMQEVVKPAAEA